MTAQARFTPDVRPSRVGRSSRPFLSVLAAGLACLALGACATGPANPLTAEQIRDLGVEVVEVNIRPDTRLWWGEAEREYARSQGCSPPERTSGSREVGAGPGASRKKSDNDCDYSALVNSPEAKAYVKERAVAVMKQQFEKAMMPAFEGPDPAVAVVDIKNVHIVSGGQALILGGSHVMEINFELKDRVNGKGLAAYYNMVTTAGYAPGGLLAIAVELMSNDPFERMSADLAVKARDWLKGETAEDGSSATKAYPN